MRRESWQVDTALVHKDSADLPRTKVQRDVTCVLLRHWRQNRALSDDVVEQGADTSLTLELGNLSAMTSSGIVVGDCVEELGVNLSLILAIFVEFFVFLVTRVTTAAARSSGTIQVLVRSQRILQVC